MENSMAGKERSKIFVVIAVILSLAGCSQDTTEKHPEVQSMQVYYLEIVTNDVDAVCSTYVTTFGVHFSDPDTLLGNARTAALHGGGLVGVRAPLREDEEPVVRPYWLVNDIEAAVAEVEKAGGKIAHPPLEIPGRGTFAIYFLGNNQHGLWQP
jgi:predicted enzyme related to lactoylglutathione lyase